MVSRWELVEPSRRNECLDTMNYAEAAARKRGWTAMTDAQWDTLEAERGIPDPEAQPDLFDVAVPVVPLSQRAASKGPREEAPAATEETPDAPEGWIEPKGSWL